MSYDESMVHSPGCTFHRSYVQCSCGWRHCGNCGYSRDAHEMRSGGLLDCWVERFGYPAEVRQSTRPVFAGQWWSVRALQEEREKRRDLLAKVQAEVLWFESAIKSASMFEQAYRLYRVVFRNGYVERAESGQMEPLEFTEWSFGRDADQVRDLYEGRHHFEVVSIEMEGV